MSEWFKSNLLSLKFKKNHYLQFRANNRQEFNVNISFDKNY
jgi:hypothetical protein